MALPMVEPVVLAAAKDALYPDIEDRAGRYTVTATQFSVGAWGGWDVSPSIHERLRPFNSIRLRSGEPELLSVGRPATDIVDGGPRDRLS